MKHLTDRENPKDSSMLVSAAVVKLRVDVIFPRPAPAAADDDDDSRL